MGKFTIVEETYQYIKKIQVLKNSTNCFPRIFAFRELIRVMKGNHQRVKSKHKG